MDLKKKYVENSELFGYIPETLKFRGEEIQTKFYLNSEVGSMLQGGDGNLEMLIFAIRNIPLIQMLNSNNAKIFSSDIIWMATPEVKKEVFDKTAVILYKAIKSYIHVEEGISPRIKEAWILLSRFNYDLFAQAYREVLGLGESRRLIPYLVKSLDVNLIPNKTLCDTFSSLRTTCPANYLLALGCSVTNFKTFIDTGHLISYDSLTDKYHVFEKNNTVELTKITLDSFINARRVR